MNTLGTFKAFLDDPNADDMYITGPAGTGKTTDLRYLVEHCQQLELDYTVCAFTHKACGILRTKLPSMAIVRTLHSFLKKRPGINQDALHVDHVQSSSKHGDADKTKLLFIDEYSMVGEKDLMDIRAAQDEEDESSVKVIWLGDPNQLPPVGDQQSVSPYGKYCVTLTKQYRNDNPLQKVLVKLIAYINGEQASPLEDVPGYFTRDQDIVQWYTDNLDTDGVMLAFTNERVQELNTHAQGYGLPKEGDRVFSPSTREFYTFTGVEMLEMVSYINLPYGDPLGLGTKYKTLEYILKKDRYAFANLVNEEGDPEVFCCIFGHYDYKCAKEELMAVAARTNKAIVDDNPGVKPAIWAARNREHPLAKKRAKAWRDYISFNECCICLDFAHAMTVHKSQGSTYENVYLDMQDLSRVASTNYKLYLKLLYVAISRASKRVVTN